MNIDQLTKLFLTIFILSVALFVLIYSLISYYNTYMTAGERQKLKTKIKSNQYLIIPMGPFFLLIVILLLYAFIMDENVLLIIKNIFFKKIDV